MALLFIKDLVLCGQFSLPSLIFQ